MRAGGVEWGSVEEMLASLIELTDMGNRLTYAGNSGKKPPWKPVKIPRPGQLPAGKRKPTPKRDLVKFFRRRGAAKVGG